MLKAEMKRANKKIDIARQRKNQMLEIRERNEQKFNEKVASLEEYAADNIQEERSVFENVVGQDSLTRFDRPKNNRKRNKNKNKKRRNQRKRPAKNA